jgi:hypothetical protein
MDVSTVCGVLSSIGALLPGTQDNLVSVANNSTSPSAVEVANVPMPRLFPFQPSGGPVSSHPNVVFSPILASFMNRWVDVFVRYLKVQRELTLKQQKFLNRNQDIAVGESDKVAPGGSLVPNNVSDSPSRPPAVSASKSGITQVPTTNMSWSLLGSDRSTTEPPWLGSHWVLGC